MLQQCCFQPFLRQISFSTEINMSPSHRNKSINFDQVILRHNKNTRIPLQLFCFFGIIFGPLQKGSGVGFEVQ